MFELRFASGTVEIHGEHGEDLGWEEEKWSSRVKWDSRTDCHRAMAIEYADIVMRFVRGKHEYKDEARKYQSLERGMVARKTPRPYQNEAIEAWNRARGRGVVVLPTGAGKSYVAAMAIEAKKRSALIVAPTLDLVRQWHGNLRAAFGIPVGIIGGGQHTIENLTVTTYDSAHIHMENIGNRFGLVIFDECHHLPSESYALSAKSCLAPFRLGLTATPERADEREDWLNTLIGPEVYRRDIIDMSGDYLADYETTRIDVDLTPEERDEYERERGIYRAFLRDENIRMSDPSGWGEFIKRASWSAIGRRAFVAYRRQRQLAFAASEKMNYVAHLLFEHRKDRSILFTQDNATAYELSKRFLIPVITHHTKMPERTQILDGLRSGIYNAVATSKVLNEGVDVPSASVAIVVSGSGSVREHVQRLGRVLRKQGNKRATMYELVTAGTGEAYTSERRREHSAYRHGGNNAHG